MRFVLNHQDVHSVCISFNNFDDVATYSKLSGGRLSAVDQAKLNAYREGSCPYGVPIQGLLTRAHQRLTLA
jgi:hypothetical protein